MKLKLFFCAFLATLTFTVTAQSSADSIYFERIYHTCKVWGHVKYYHSNISDESIDWDNELITRIDSIKNSSTNEEFNQILLSMINSVGEMAILTTAPPEVLDSIRIISNYDWIENQIFSDEVKSKLLNIKTNFQPQENKYVFHYGEGSIPVFDVDDQYYESPELTLNEPMKVLAIARYWNIINYFYPYKHLMDQDWDTTLHQFIPIILNSTNNTEYGIAFRQFTSRIDDSHSIFLYYPFQQYIGYYDAPFKLKYIDGETVVVKTLPSASPLEVGDVIKEMDGYDIYEYRDSLRSIAFGSNEATINRYINFLLQAGNEGSFNVKATDGVSLKSMDLIRNDENYNLLYQEETPSWRDTVICDEKRIGIVNMGVLESDEVEEMFMDLWDTEAIVFDIRNYPNGTLWDMVDYLYINPVNVANFTVPNTPYPGTMIWRSAILGNPQMPVPYSGRVIILFDEETQSQAEYTVMGIEQHPNSVKIGSTTAAADGDVRMIYLPGYMRVYATFLGVYYPDYTPTQRIGIIPDHEVYPTIEGIRQGRDEVLEYALSCDIVSGSGVEALNEMEVSVHPNPTDGNVWIETSSIIDRAVVFDQLGHHVSEYQPKSFSFSVDLNGEKEGIYFVKISSQNVVKTFKIVKY